MIRRMLDDGRVEGGVIRDGLGRFAAERALATDLARIAQTDRETCMLVFIRFLPQTGVTLPIAESRVNDIRGMPRPLI